MPISLAEAIRNAIAAEQAAERFYQRLAALCADVKGREILTGIAAQEHAHAATLERLAAELVAGQLPEGPDALVQVIETAPLGDEAGSLDLAEALSIALDAENSAVLYYDALATTASGDAATFFARMGEEEAGHAASIRTMLETL
jgi:rubrerythrin